MSELAAHPFLAGLAPRLVAALEPHVRAREIAAGTWLLREGEPALESFLIVNGLVALEVHFPDRGARQIARIGAGEVVGWSWLTEVRRWHFDARAVEPTRALVLDGRAVVALCERDGELGFALSRRFLGVVTRRVEALRLQLLDLYGGGP